MDRQRQARRTPAWIVALVLFDVTAFVLALAWLAAVDGLPPLAPLAPAAETERDACFVVASLSATENDVALAETMPLAREAVEPVPPRSEVRLLRSESESHDARELFGAKAFAPFDDDAGYPRAFPLCGHGSSDAASRMRARDWTIRPVAQDSALGHDASTANGIAGETWTLGEVTDWTFTLAPDFEPQRDEHGALGWFDSLGRFTRPDADARAWFPSGAWDELGCFVEPDPTPPHAACSGLPTRQGCVSVIQLPTASVLRLADFEARAGDPER